jgi:hypothetical protein
MLAAALVVGACGPGDEDYGSVSYGGGYSDGCRRFASCSACTPVNGCGWCFDSDGTGICAASPDECVTPAFSWTWNPSGCRVAADAGAATPPEDAAAAPPAQDAMPTGVADVAVSDAAGPTQPAADGATSIDAQQQPPDASATDGAPL